MLTVLNKVERLYSKDNYRIIKITVYKDTDIQKLIKIKRKQKILVLHYDIEKDYAHGTAAIIAKYDSRTKNRMSGCLRM